ncbi:MAG TPA: glycerate kinase [Algoriphagus sp.]|nr:glycerate kinase [Algoriphagus sp.]
MRLLIAPNAFKGTIPADQAAEIIAKEIGKDLSLDCTIQPVADGGDGTCHLLIESLNLEKIPVLTLNAVGQPIEGYFGWDSKNKKAFLDISTASGIGVLEGNQKDPHITSTFGTGLIIQKAVEIGAREVILGLGGSATVDLGTGILNALGILFLDEKGREIPAFSQGFLKSIRHIQKSPLIPKIKFTCLCDVRNLFFGENGAVKVFGPQKGLSPNHINSFEKDCETVTRLLVKKSQKEWLDRPGFGAAGGVALGLSLFFETEIEFGAHYFLELVNMKEKILQSDWIITGEGQYDAQSDQGKASFELLKLAQANHKKIALITSGTGGEGSGFDLILELPALDFSSPDYKEKARQNLSGLINAVFKDRKFV